MYKLLLALIMVVITTAGTACINLTERIPGVGIEDVEFYSLGEVEIDRDSLKAFIRKTTATCSGKLSRECNDLVIAHLFTEEFKTALGLSTRLVAKYPDDYSVVITHAAALELNGRPADAIPFMKRALELNPKSHKGSEWIHLKILEQRVLGDAGIDPWALIGVDLRPDSVLVKPAGVDMVALVKQVHYQVNDRLFFTPKHDPLYGALMFAYADLLQLNGYRNQAKWTYAQAAAYGFTYAMKHAVPVEPVVKAGSAPVVDEAAPTTAAGPEKRSSYASLYAWLMIAVIVSLAGWFIWRNSRTA